MGDTISPWRSGIGTRKEPEPVSRYRQRIFGMVEAPTNGTSRYSGQAPDSTPHRVEIARWQGGGSGVHTMGRQVLRGRRAWLPTTRAGIPTGHATPATAT